MNATTNEGRYLMAVLTGSTCGFPCWQADEDVCRCSCGGANHGILRAGGCQPQRTAKIDGQFYELVGVIPGPSGDECWADAFKREGAEVARTIEERFPDLDSWAYGEYRPAGKTLPVVSRKVQPSHAKWPEVAVVPNACRLIWARPTGSAYARRADRRAA